MTKNYTPVKFQIETLENRDAPMTAGSLINGGAGVASIMSGWGEFKQSNDLQVAFGQLIQEVSGPVS